MTDPFAPTAGEPVSLIIGAFAAWTVDDGFDADDYSLKYVFRQGVAAVELAGSYTSGAWTFTANSAFTATLSSGRHILDLIVVRLSDGEEKVVRTSTITCFDTVADRTSHAQTMVEKIESILEGRADHDVESYTIKSRSITKMSVRELTDWREYYLAELGRQVNDVTGKRPRNNSLKVGFV